MSLRSKLPDTKDAADPAQPASPQKSSPGKTLEKFRLSAAAAEFVPANPDLSAVSEAQPPLKNPTREVKLSLTAPKFQPTILLRHDTGEPLTLDYLLQQLGIPAEKGQILKELAKENEVYLKGGFAVFAMMCTFRGPQFSPLRIKDLDFEVKYEKRDSIEQVLGRHKLTISKECKDEHFFNVDHTLQGNFTCEMTFIVNGYRSYDPFNLTRMRVKLDASGVLSYPDSVKKRKGGNPSQLDKIERHFAEKIFGVNWVLFETEPRVENGLGRFAKYLCQVEFRGYKLGVHTHDGFLKPTSIDNYLSNKQDARALYRDMAEISSQYFNLKKQNALLAEDPEMSQEDMIKLSEQYLSVMKDNELKPSLVDWHEYNKKWLLRLEALGQRIVYEIIVKEKRQFKDPQTLIELSAQLWSDLQSDIEKRGKQHDGFKFPAKAITVAFVSSHLLGLLSNLPSEPTVSTGEAMFSQKSVKKTVAQKPHAKPRHHHKAATKPKAVPR